MSDEKNNTGDWNTALAAVKELVRDLRVANDLLKLHSAR